MEKYSDLDLRFLKHPNTRDVVKRYDIDAVKNAVLNLLRTNQGEKKFKPNYGGDIRSLLFEPLTSANQEILKRKWNEMLKMWEPRAVINNLQVTAENNEVYILVEVALKERPDITFVLPLSVERIR